MLECCVFVDKICRVLNIFKLKFIRVEVLIFFCRRIFVVGDWLEGCFFFR